MARFINGKVDDIVAIAVTFTVAIAIVVVAASLHNRKVTCDDCPKDHHQFMGAWVPDYVRIPQ